MDYKIKLDIVQMIHLPIINRPDIKLASLHSHTDGKRVSDPEGTTNTKSIQ